LGHFKRKAARTLVSTFFSQMLGMLHSSGAFSVITFQCVFDKLFVASIDVQASDPPKMAETNCLDCGHCKAVHKLVVQDHVLHYLYVSNTSAIPT
jgi:hypothetical protein